MVVHIVPLSLVTVYMQRIDMIIILFMAVPGIYDYLT